MDISKYTFEEAKKSFRNLTQEAFDKYKIKYSRMSDAELTRNGSVLSWQGALEFDILFKGLTANKVPEPPKMGLPRQNFLSQRGKK